MWRGRVASRYLAVSRSIDLQSEFIPHLWALHTFSDSRYNHISTSLGARIQSHDGCPRFYSVIRCYCRMRAQRSVARVTPWSRKLLNLLFCVSPNCIGGSASIIAPMELGEPLGNYNHGHSFRRVRMGSHLWCCPPRMVKKFEPVVSRELNSSPQHSSVQGPIK